MGMMTGSRWRRGIAAVALTLAVPAVAGCEPETSLAAESSEVTTTGLDANGREACAEFRSGWQRATDTAARLQLADAVERHARRSDSAAVSDSAAAMGRSADDGDQAWRAASDDLLRTCGQAGSSTGAAEEADAPAGTEAPALPVTG